MIELPTIVRTVKNDVKKTTVRRRRYANVDGSFTLAHNRTRCYTTDVYVTTVEDVLRDGSIRLQMRITSTDTNARQTYYDDTFGQWMNRPTTILSARSILVETKI